MDLNLGIDIANRQLLSPTGSALTLPSLVQGDTVDVVLQGMQLLSNGDYALVPIEFSTIKMAIGFIDAPPTSGTFTLTVGIDTTPALGYNSSPQFVQSQLNALATVSSIGGVTVFSPGASNVWVIGWNNPAVTTSISIGSTDLFPYCFNRVIPYPLQNGAIAWIVKLFQAPVAFTDQFALPTSPAVTCVQVQAGTGLLSEVQKLIIPSTAQGEFTLTFGTLTTLVIPVATATATVIAAALNAMFSDGVTRFNVIQPGSDYYYIQFVGPLANTTYSAMTITMLSQPPLITPTASLNLNVPGIEIALDGAASVGMMLQIEIINSTPGTPILVPVTILASMIDSTMALAVNPTWLVDALTVSSPNNTTQATAVGLLGYEQTVGDTIATTWTVNHNLGTQNLFIEVIDNNTQVRIPDNLYIATIPNTNQVTITFPTAPTLNQYRTIVTSAYATTYLPQLSLTIADIAGLQAALNALSSQGDPLDFWPIIPLSKLPQIPFSQLSGSLPSTLLPANVALLDPNGDLPLTNLPASVPRLASDGSLVVSSNSTSANPTWTQILTPTGTLSPDVLGNLAAVPSFVTAVQTVLAGAGVSSSGKGTLIPLTMKSEVIGYAGTLPTATATGFKNVDFPTRPPSLIPPSSTPTIFNRELWRVAVNDKLVAESTTLQIDWGVSLQILRPNCGTEYKLVAEIGTYADSGSNLAITWQSSPIFTQPIMLTEELTVHSFGLTLVRSLVGSTDTITLAQQIYGTSYANNAAAPSSANFAVRCRLINLETESSSVQPDPRGWISYAVVPSTTVTAAIARAIISNN